MLTLEKRLTNEPPRAGRTLVEDVSGPGKRAASPLIAWWRRRRVLETPTATIYFAGPMAGLIGRPGDRARPIWRLGPNVYHRHGPDPHTVVLRSFDFRTRAAMASHGPARLHYVIDDDVHAGADEPDLPVRYRKRLARLRDGVMSRMLAHAQHVYAASEHLADRLTALNGTVEEIRPTLAAPVADLLHHDDGPLHLVFPGTRSHLADLEAVAGDVRRFLQTRPQAMLTTWLGDAAPDALRLPNAVHHRGLDWPGFRAVLRTRRFHIALLPARPTAFNAARSHNKVLECACLGAAPLVGRAMPYADLVRDASSGTVVEADGWLGALSRLDEDRAGLRRQAEANRALALRIGGPERLLHFWSDRLGL